MATMRQKKAFSSVVNGSTIKGAMVKAGYSLETSKRTNKLTATKGWEELMEKHLPDSLLARKHKEGLDAVKKENKIVGRDEDGAPEYDMIDVDDFGTRHKYLDSAYKLKGRYKSGDQISVNVPSPILNVLFVNNSHTEGSGAEKTPEGGTGRDISQQNSINHPLLDTLSPERQDPDANEHSK